jgi:hypothetical protein
MDQQQPSRARSDPHPIWTVLAVIGAGTIVLLALIAIHVTTESFMTRLVEAEDFAGLKPLQKRTTNIIIVHGIGHHCIGYADPLISGLMRQITESNSVPVEPVVSSYERYWTAELDKQRKQRVSADEDSRGKETPPGASRQEKGASARAERARKSVEVTGDTLKVASIDPPRDGHCRIRIPADARPVRSTDVNLDDDLDSVVIGQNKLCEFLNDERKHPGRAPRTYCHKLSVKLGNPSSDELDDYITGFVRQFEADAGGGKVVRIYEVTWTPATRWLKQSLSGVDRFNAEMSLHRMNNRLKDEIMNAGIADAVAYMSDSGILVNYNVLQTFCLALANQQSTFSDYAFTCNAGKLGGSRDSFVQNNDVFLISHSLGTRVVLDSIGLLSLAVPTADTPSEEKDLVAEIHERFGKIGAVIDQNYLDESDDGFRARLREQVPGFARSIRSVYVFTNQLPLLAALADSPFKDKPEVSRGFEHFLSLRQDNGHPARALQIVSFHDPDDVLSYNLGCWYHGKVLLKNSDLNTRLYTEAKNRATRKEPSVAGADVAIGLEHRALREAWVNNNCAKHKLSNQDRKLFEQIKSEESSRVRLRSVTVRLRSYRLRHIFADPQQIHSNYFLEAQVHRWLTEGHHNGSQ